MSNTDVSAKKALNKKLIGIIGVLLVIIIIIACSLTMCGKETGNPVSGETGGSNIGEESTSGEADDESDDGNMTADSSETPVPGQNENTTGDGETRTEESNQTDRESVSGETKESTGDPKKESNSAEESSPVEESSGDETKESSKANESTEADKTTEAVKTTEADETTGSSKPTSSTKPSGSSKPTESTTKPAESTTEATKPTEPTKVTVTITDVNATPKKTIYAYGYKLAASDLTVKVSYSDGSEKTVTNGFTVSQTGYYVTVTYEGVKSEAVRVYFEDPAVKSVSITATADEYANGYKLTESDLNVIATYEDNSKSTIANGFTITQTGTKVYVTYESVKSNTITISYSAAATEPAKPTLKTVTVSAKASQYTDGYKLTNSDLTVKAAYSDGTTKTITNGFTISQTGTELYVTYNGVKSNTITITYKAPETEAPVLKSVQISAKASEYESGYQLTSSDLTVKASYSDGSSKAVTSGYEISQSGASVYVTYQGVKSNTITLNYKAVTVTSVTISAKAAEYENGYQLTTGDLNVAVGYSNGTSSQIGSDYSIVQSGTSVYVTYQGVTSNTITIAYKQPEPVKVTSITASTKQASYEINSSITAADLNVTAHYSDGSSVAVSDGVTLLYTFDTDELPFEEVGSLHLAEYVNAYGNSYYMGSSGVYVVRASYQGIQSEDVTVNTHYSYSKRLCPEMLDLVNQARAAEGLPALSWDSNAENAVLTRVDELLVSYSHDRPNGELLRDLYSLAGLENINHAGGIDLTYGVQSCFDSWMNSAGHKAAILNSDSFFTGFACAEVRDPVNGTYWVMIICYSPN